MSDSNNKPELRRGQMTLGRMLGVIGIIAVGCAFAPRMFNRMHDDIGSVLSVVLFVSMLVGAGAGLLARGTDGAFRGMLLALLLFLVAGVVLVVLTLIKIAN
jgi:hypothetical protein